MNGAIRPMLLLLVAALLPACGTHGEGTLNPTDAPNIPGDVEGVGAPERAVLTWTRRPAATSYTVRRSLSSGGPYLEIPGGSGVPAATFKDLGLVNGTAYYYVVTASNRFGTSPPSPEVKVVPGFKATQVACGYQYSAALMKDGSVWAWGSNFSSQLGPATSERFSSIAVEIPIPDPVVSISCGQGHMLALSSLGRVWAWGDNTRGQLGHTLGQSEFIPSFNIPMEVPGLSGVVAVSAGYESSLALLADGTVLAWGSNQSGQLGIGPGPDSLVPSPVPGVSGITQICAGQGFNLAVTSEGGVLAWGPESALALGTGLAVPPFGTPVPVSNLNGVRSVSTGPAHSTALGLNGEVWTWGSGSGGQLGIPTLDDSPFRIRVANLMRSKAVSAGSSHTVAVGEDGTVWCWGANQFGALGIPPDPARPTEFQPIQADGLHEIVACATGYYHNLALDKDGTIFGWGDDTFGQLGNGGGGSHLHPVNIRNLDSVVDISANYSRALGVRADGTVWCWGTSMKGEAGDGSSNVPMLYAPVRASGLTDVIAAGAGAEHSVALKSDGSVWTWGSNQEGILGYGSNLPDYATVPGQVPGLSGGTAVAAGGGHSMALVGGGVWCWGANGGGQLGGGYVPNDFAPIRVVRQTATTFVPLTGVIAISGGAGHSLALRSNGTVWAWGGNYQGELGDIVPVGGRFFAARVPGLTGITAISAGWQYSLALRNDGTVWAWGDNHDGQLGQDPGVMQVIYDATPIQGLTDVVAIAACGFHSMALKSDGTVWCWGKNDLGQLGNGTLVSSYVPVQVQGLSGIGKISGGLTFSLSLSTTGVVRGWGSNESAQLTVHPTNSAFLAIEITR